MPTLPTPTLDDDLAALDRLLGPELLSLLDRLEVADTMTDVLSRSDARNRHDALSADIATGLALVRRRLEHGLVPARRDELTMPLPLADHVEH